jgi:membrane associated rhomboid family serine protease
MGIYDRPYYQDESPQGFSLGGQRSIVTNLIIINVVIFFVDAFTSPVTATSHWLSYHMAVGPETLTEPWNWWKLLTYGFAHASLAEANRGAIFHVGFNMYALWLFGRDVETVRGRREFLIVYLALVVLAGLAWAVLQRLMGAPASMVGASGAVTGIMILFVCHFPHRKFMLLFVPVPVAAWVLVGGFILLDVFGAMSLRSGDNVAYTCHLAGAAFAFAYYRSGLRLEGVAAGKVPGISLKALRPRPKLRVHDPDARYRDLDRKADHILEKLHREGADSLTAAERRILEDYSRRMRQKHS